MKAYFSLLKLQLKYMLKPGDSKSSKWLWLAYAIIGLVFGGLIVSICFSVSMLADTFNQLGLLPELVTLILLLACMMLLVFGLVPMLNYLYFANDTEFMMSLPVSASAVYFSKMSVVYLTEVALSVVFALPCLVTVGATLGLGAMYYTVVFFATLLVPAIPLVLVSVLAIPLMYVVSFFKRKGALTSIVLILLFGFVFFAYTSLIGGLEASLEDGEVVDFSALVIQFTSSIKSVCRILVPLISIARVSVFSSDTLFGVMSSPALATIVNLAVFIAFIVLTAAVAMLVSSSVYRRGAKSMLEGGGSTKRGDSKFRSSSVFLALIKKEWRELVRTPAFAFQCLSGVILCPIMLLLMSTSMGAGLTTGMDGAPLGETEAKLIEIFMSFFLLLIVGMMGVSLNVGAATTISREGRNFYVMKTMPVPVNLQIKAKMTLYLIISTVTVIVAQTISAFLFFNLINTIFGTVFLLLYNYGYNCFCIYMDLNKPKLNWVTHNEAVKNNKTATITMLINMAVFIVLAIIPVLALVIIPSLAVAMAVLWSLLIIIAITIAIVSHVLLYNNAERLINRINA